nr:hypothetical protein [Modestobacter muralis]
MADLAAPVPACGPWLTAALNVQSTRPLARVRPRAVVVERGPDGGPDGVALLALRRRGATTAVTLLGAEPGPLPEGRPPARLLARDPEVAAHLAEGLVDLLERLRGPWTLRLAGLPLGDPTLAALAAVMPDSQLSNSRTRRLVDDLDTVGDVHRTVDPVELERLLPAVLARVPAPQQLFVRAAARLHAAIGQLELAVVGGGPDGRPAAVLLTLLDRGPAGTDRWPWWGSSDVGGLRRELGQPSVTLTASAGLVRLGRRSPLRAAGGASTAVRGAAAG